MMVYKSGVLRLWSRGETGLFACTGGSPSPGAVEDALCYWRRAGCRQAFGPVAMGAADVMSGLCIWRAPEKAELLAPKRAADDRALLAAGFVREKESLAFRLQIPRIPERAGMQVTPGVSAEDCAAVMGGDAEHARLALAEMGGYLDPEFCFTAHRDGAAGILICLRKRRQLRILTLWSRADCRNGAACIPLLRALETSARRAGIDTADASQIPADNPFSLRLAQRLGGRVIGRYAQYRIQL